MSYSVPHVTQLPYTLTEGKEITIRGVVHPHAEGFGIGLSVGHDHHNTDIPFVFNPRFTQNEVVRNHKYSGWGNEEKHGGFPFQKGAPYEVKIAVRNHAYQVFVNNNFFCDFNHRVAKESARHLYINGDTSITGISFSEVVYSPPVPVTVPIHGGAYAGRTIVINGVPTGNSRFTLSLNCGPNYDCHDVAFVFDVRFNVGSNHNQVIRNHRVGATWGGEETHQNYFPFSVNTPFEIMILIEHHGFKVVVNNQHFTEFNHRLLPYQRVSHLHITGDVSISQIKV